MYVHLIAKEDGSLSPMSIGRGAREGVGQEERPRSSSHRPPGRSTGSEVWFPRERGHLTSDLGPGNFVFSPRPCRRCFLDTLDRSSAASSPHPPLVYELPSHFHPFVIPCGRNLISMFLKKQTFPLYQIKTKEGGKNARKKNQYDPYVKKTSPKNIEKRRIYWNSRTSVTGFSRCLVHTYIRDVLALARFIEKPG